MVFLDGADIKDTAISGTVVDWRVQQIFYKDIGSNTTFTFTNVIPGKTINVAVRNTTGGVLTVSFPTNVEPSGFTWPQNVAAGKENVYTFILSNGKVYVSNVDGMG
jgi:hypothetical protein